MRHALLALALLVSAPAFALDIDVDTTEDGADPNPGDGVCDDGAGNCTLRAAVQTANASGGSDTINLPAGVYRLAIKRDSADDEGTGDLDVTDTGGTLTIRGAGQSLACDGVGATCIDGKKGKDRVFDVATDADLRLEDLSVKNGKAAKDDFNRTQFEEVSGGCIRVDGCLSTDDVTIDRCKSPDDGGCIGFTDFSEGDLEDTFLNKCKSKDGGGGIEVDLATLDADRVTIANSKASEGGGIEATGGTLDMKNLTFSKNKAKMGGAFFAESDADAEFNNTTFFDNKAKLGHSVFADEFSMFFPVTLANSLLRSKKELNCEGPISSDGGNLENGTTCAFGITDCSDCDPSISKDLLDNGGEVPTHAIDQFSEAIGNGLDMSCEATDARGAGRNGVCDSGSFEFNGIFP